MYLKGLPVIYQHAHLLIESFPTEAVKSSEMRATQVSKSYIFRSISGNNSFNQ